jgi:hypothetical protein
LIGNIASPHELDGPQVVCGGPWVVQMKLLPLKLLLFSTVPLALAAIRLVRLAE